MAALQQRRCLFHGGADSVITAFATLVTIAESASRSSDPSSGSGVQLAARAVHGAESNADTNKIIHRKRIATFILLV
jgi:hypothetical protein